MPVRPVVRYPDPLLKLRAEPTDPAEREQLARDLVDTMHASPATVGLAAPQIGVSSRAFVLDVSGHPRASTSHGLLVAFDPEIVEQGGAEVRREGCLSVPDLTADVRRATTVALSATTAEGGRGVFHMEGFEARAVLHEMDHLDGLLILDRVDAPSGLFPRRVYR